jgi:hypothetical protein
LSSSVAIPSGRCRPSAFGIYALRDGLAGSALCAAVCAGRGGSPPGPARRSPTSPRPSRSQPAGSMPDRPPPDGRRRRDAAAPKTVPPHPPSPDGARDPAHLTRPARLCVRHAFCWPRSPRPAPFPPPPPPPASRCCSATSQVLRSRLTSHDRSSRACRLSVPRATRPAINPPGDHGTSLFSRPEIPCMPKL